jgi:molybdopterin synthase catalytic subunit
MIRLSSDKIKVEDVIASVASDDAGAIDVFIGTVRNQTKNKKVIRLEFEAYESMAIKELEMIRDRAQAKWPILKIAIVHATGVLEIGDIPVVIAVATPHRNDAFEACKFVIDELKKTVPIWKKEFYEDGEIWVSAHP